MNAPSPSAGRRYDPDRLAHLEDERDFLLRSLDDLDAEFEAGDLSATDYEGLRDGYTTRAAEAIRAIEAIEEGRGAEEDAAGSPSRAWVWVLGAVVFAVLAGVALARNVGLRSGDDAITGTVADGATDVRNCIQESFGDTAAGIACFDEVLEETPEDVEALTYRAWAMVRSGEVADGGAELDAVIAADPTYPDAYVFRAVVARDEGDAVAAQGYLDTLYSLDPPPTVLTTLRQLGLERDIAVMGLSEESRQCWDEQDEALVALSQALEASGSADGTEGGDGDIGGALDAVLLSDACWDEVLMASPDDVDALALRAYGLLSLDLTLRGGTRGPASSAEISALDAKVAELVDRALELDPADPDSRVLRAALRYVVGDLPGAEEDLAALSGEPTSPLFSGVDAETIRELIESDG